MKRFASSLRTALCVIPVLLIATAAFGQYRASIQGVITDQQGAVVPQANVTLMNLETGQATKTVSDDRGIFNFNGLPPAKFSVTVEKGGFKTKQIENFGITAEQANALNVQLDVGQATETVTVNGDAAPLLDTETANLGGKVKADEFQKLASFGRDPFQLLQLAPGAFGDGSQAPAAERRICRPPRLAEEVAEGVFKVENGGQVSVNGARTGENNYQIDGVGTTSVTWGGTSVVTPNEDSIKEIKVVTDNYDAENGRYRGAQVQIISQNGTNNSHGSFFFRAHRPGLNAFTKYNGYANGNIRDDNRFNDWGGTLGGPIVKNRLFGFFSYETIDNGAQQVSGGNWYETDAFRALAASGTNAANFLNYPGVAPNGGNQVDSLGGNALNCGFIHLVEGSNCNTIAGKGLDIGSPLTSTLGTTDPSWVSTSTPGVGSGLDGVADIAFIQGTREPNTSTHRQYNGRIDFNATSKDLFAVSFYYVPNASSGINGFGDRTMNLFNTTYKNRAATAIWDHTFGATMANEARVNAAGWAEKDLANNPNAPWGLPQIYVGGMGSIGATNTGANSFAGWGIGSYNGFDQWTYAAKDVLTKVHGAHTMKMGGEFTRLLAEDSPLWSGRPGYTFNNVWDFLNDAPIQESGQFDPQTGIPGAARKDLRSNVVGLFFQDNWKVKSNLTVTAGLRWEYFGPISEIKGHLASVEFGSGANRFTDMSVRTGGSLFHAQKANFGPQLGFAWNPGGFAGHDFTNRLVIRGGIGVAYNGIAQSNSLDGRFNPPFVLNGPNFSGSQVAYIGTFPTDPHSPFGYASNPAAVANFDPNTNLPTTCCTDLTAFPHDWPTTYDFHYTLGAEYDLGHQWVASAGYQGSETRHLTTHYNLYNPGAVANLALNPFVHGVSYYGDDGNANFNALLLEVKHTFSRSFMFDTQYRLSHANDPGSNAYGGPTYQWNLASGYGTSDYDARHALKIYGVWSPTLFHGSRGWMEKVAGGWSLSGILNTHTGFPFTPVYSYGEVLPTCGPYPGINNGNPGPCEPVFNFGPSSGGGSADAGSGNMLPAAYSGGFKPNFRSNATVDATGSFTQPTIVAGTLFQCLFANPDPTLCPSGQQGYGPLPTAPGVARNSFRGPGYFDVDATLSKAFGLPSNRILGERAGLEFRINFYNLFNKLNLYNPQTDIINNHFGEAQTALGSRVIEMQARFSF